MKTKTTALLFFLLTVATSTGFADDAAKDGPSTTDLMNYIGFGAIFLTLILIVIALLVILRAFNVMSKVILGAEVYQDILDKEAAEKAARKKVKPKGEAILKLLSLKPMSEEKTLLMEHEFDGIQELDNPTPAWFMYLFYGTIAFAVCYLMIYHVFGVGQLQYDEYKSEMLAANKEKAAFLAKAANRVDENSVKLTIDPVVLSSGQAIFKERCAPCHGDHAQGNVGPNLTDDYWLHGGKINEVFKTIKYGVSAKGMPTWQSQLTPKQIADVANYVKSLHGSNPANPKEPQGDKEADDNTRPAAKTAMVTKQ